MGKVNYANEICNAITEIKTILTSGMVKAPLLIERLECEKQRLLNELYEAVHQKRTTAKQKKTISKQQKPTSSNTKPGGPNDNG